MKYVFEFLLITVFLGAAQARDIVLIQHWEEPERAQIVRDILLRQMNLPAGLITIRQKLRPCEPRSQAVVHICFDEQHEMHFPYLDHVLLERTLKIFGEIKDEETNETRP